MLSTILVPLDGSSLAEQSLPFAERLAQVAKARVILARVVPAFSAAETSVAASIARAARENRRTPFPGYFTDFMNWLPVMESYEGGAPGYFGTPAVTLLANLHTALEELAAEPMPARVARHARIGGAFKAGVADLGLQNVAAPEANANTLTVVRNPAGVGDELVDAVRAEGVTIARAIHPELRGGSFRVGHMGVCGPAEILTTLGAIERALHRLGAPVEFGAGLGAAQRALAG